LLASRSGVTLKRSKERSLVAEVRIGDALVVLAFPQTFMNDSGHAVSQLVRRYGVTDVSRIVIVHDELDLPLGRLKVKLGGGLAGHNGLRSIRQHLHDDGFARIRIGVGKPVSKERGADHVLGRLARSERAELDVVEQEAADAVETIIRAGVDAAMTRFNRASESPGEENRSAPTERP
jgi:PTH1 family peptidyl-tRNA hydrolase